MKIAIMQPYFFPYLGYYQLVSSVDNFIFFDNVNFIKKGFINRNNILNNNKASLFTVPVEKVSQNRKINEHFYTGNFQPFLNQINSSYSSSPFFKEIFPIIEFVVSSSDKNVSIINKSSIESVFKYLEIEKKFSKASDFNIPKDKKGVKRIIDICHLLQANTYINAIGGKALYDKELFSKKNIKIKFLNPDLPFYSQNNNIFIPGLSIIDILMNCDKNTIRKMLSGGTLE
ncbi:WbqC family protein [Photorhabdus asymbiotica]|uniref:WbqC family protein n=1 Tax=Photorhabdus asymbiotica TaxID=291112 RepID=UPI003DA7487B